MANFTITPASPTVGQTVRVQSTSVDPDNGPQPLQYFWNFDGDATIDAGGPTAQTVYGTAGPAEIRLAIYDGCPNGLAGIAKTITVRSSAPAIPIPGGQATIDAGSACRCFRFIIGPFRERVRGRVTFKTVKKHRLPATGATTSQARRRKKRLVLGAKRFTGRKGKRTKVVVTMKPRHFALLVSKGKLRVRATIALRDSDGNRNRKRRSFTLRAPSGS